MPATEPPESLRLLLSRAIDYAGLFPPAALAMGDAVRNYAAYRSGLHEWMLGRFIVPVDRLEEMEAGVRQVTQHGGSWQISLLVPPDTFPRLSDREDAAAWTAVIQVTKSVPAVFVASAAEIKVSSVADVKAIGRGQGSAEALPVYCEIPRDGDARRYADAAAEAGVLLKARTGGITADAFPSAGSLADFTRACVERKVGFKLTAGLHHALRGDYPLTYERGSPCGGMFGFLNVILAAALCVTGADRESMLALLTESDASAFTFDGDGAGWRGERLSLDDIRGTRSLLHAFGSCSFEEPLQELTAMGLL